MGVHNHQQPFPQRVRRTFALSRGVYLPDIVSVASSGAQGTPSDPAKQVQHISTGTGSLTFALLPPNPITVLVPLTGITTPFSPSQSIIFSPGAPTIALPGKALLGSVQAIPAFRTSISPKPIFSGSLAPGLPVEQFFVQVTFTVDSFPLGDVTVSCSGDLLTSGETG